MDAPGEANSQAEEATGALRVEQGLGFTVRISIRSESGDWKPNGSGILVSQRHVLTCWHVAGTFEPKPLPFEQRAIRVEVAGEAMPFPVTASWAASRELPGLGKDFDAVLLELEGKVEAHEPARLAAAYDRAEFAPVTEGRDLSAWGFARGSESASSSTGPAGAGSAELAWADGRRRMADALIDYGADRGLSGGPTVLETASGYLCVGMNRLGGDYATKTKFLTSAVLLTLLEHAGCKDQLERVSLADWAAPAAPPEGREEFLKAQHAWLLESDSFLASEEIEPEFLDEVYVPLELQARPPRKATELGAVSWKLPALLAEKPDRFGRESHRWLLVGHPGSGKSTTLRRLAKEAADTPRGRWTPLYLRLPHLAQYLPDGGDPWACLIEAIRASWESEEGGIPLDDAREARLVAERSAGRLLLLLDGLDEVQAGRKRVKLWLEKLSSKLGESAVVVTTRHLPSDRPASGYLEADLRELDPREQVRFLQRWIDGRDAELPPCSAEDWIRFLREQPSLRDLAGNPLGLTLVGILLRHGKDPAPRRRALLLQVLEHILWGTTKDGARLDHPDLAREALGELAVWMSRAGVDELPYRELDKRLGKCEALLQNSHWGGDVTGLREAIRDRTSVLGPFRGRGRWAFWHRSFQEALTAEWLVSLDTLEARLAAADSLDESKLPFWAEPFAMLAEGPDPERPGGSHSSVDPDELLLALHERGHTALALRALQGVPNAKGETLLEILALSGADQRAPDRGAAILRVPELLGNDEDGAVRSLGVLARLGQQLQRKSEPFWSDLYFVDEALGKVGEQEGLAQASLERRRGLLEAWFRFPSEEAVREVGLLPGTTPWEPWPAIPRTEEVWLGSPTDEAGRNHDETPYRATLSAFRLGATPVTRGQYELFDPDHDCPGPADAPVTEVDWYQAMLFSRWIGFALGGDPGDLPTEAQWEYACRGGKRTAYWSGNTGADLDRVGWLGNTSALKVHAVGEKPANGYGLHDVHGNVREWCSDWYGDYRSEEADPLQDPPEPPQGGVRVLRGGSFWSFAGRCRSAYRSFSTPDTRNDDVGFRVALPVAEA